MSDLTLSLLITLLFVMIRKNYFREKLYGTDRVIPCFYLFDFAMILKLASFFKTLQTRYFRSIRNMNYKYEL